MGKKQKGLKKGKGKRAVVDHHPRSLHATASRSRLVSLCLAAFMGESLLPVTKTKHDIKAG